MSDKDCFDFLDSINYDKQYFIDKGWTKKYHHNIRGWRWWPECFKDEENLEDNWVEWFPPGFKLSEEKFDDDKGVYPKRCCANCKNSKNKYSREHAYGCRLPEVRTAYDSTVLKGKDYITPGHSNPCFVWEVKFAPNAICDYFEEFNYNL